MALKQKILAVWASAIFWTTWVYAGNQTKCNKLSISNWNEKTSEIVKIVDWKWQIWEYVVEIKNKIVKVFIPESDSITTKSKLINNWNWDCEVWKLLSVK